MRHPPNKVCMIDGRTSQMQSIPSFFSKLELYICTIFITKEKGKNAMEIE